MNALEPSAALSFAAPRAAPDMKPPPPEEARPEPLPSAPHAPNVARRGGRFWLWFVVFLIVAPAAGLITMVAVAVRDPSFAVEENYYLKELAWDDTAAQGAANTALGWHFDVAPLAIPAAAGAPVDLVVTLRDRAGALLADARVSVEAFANARAANILRTTLAPAGDGHYRAALGVARPGVWELRLVAVYAKAKFTEVVRAEVAAPGSTP